jgi:hypothetical protein
MVKKRLGDFVLFVPKEGPKVLLRGERIISIFTRDDKFSLNKRYGKPERYYIVITYDGGFSTVDELLHEYESKDKRDEAFSNYCGAIL